MAKETVPISHKLVWKEHDYGGALQGTVTRIFGLWTCFTCADGAVEICQLSRDGESWFEACAGVPAALAACRRGPPKEELPAAVLPIGVPPLPQRAWLEAARGLAKQLEIELPPARPAEHIFAECGEVADAIDAALTAAGEGLYFHPLHGVCSS